MTKANYFIDKLVLANYKFAMIKLNQKTIAKKAGISEPFVSQIVNGKKRPTWTKAKKLADATTTNPELWLEGTPDQIRDAIKNASKQ